MKELEEWDRIHTLPLVSFVHDDRPEEVEIGVVIRTAVIDVEEGFEETMVSWGVNARTGRYVLPDVLHFPFEAEAEVEVEVEAEGEDWSISSEVWDRQTI